MSDPSPAPAWFSIPREGAMGNSKLDSPRGLAVGPVLLVLLCGCTAIPHACDRSCVSAKVTERTGFSVGPRPPGKQVLLPNGASLEDGLTEEEAILIALWNNAAFQELLA